MKKLWSKGQSGNPGGRPKKVLQLLKLCRTHTKKAILFAVGLLDEPEFDDADNKEKIMHRKVKMEAAKFIANYGLGAPRVSTEDMNALAAQTGPLDGLTTEELRALARREMKPDEPSDTGPN